MVLVMGIYRESYKVKKPIDDVEKIGAKLKQSTGLDYELEIVDDKNFFIHSEKFGSSIEVNVGSDGEVIYLFYPAKKKGYFEYSVLYVLKEYISNEIEVPLYSQKLWSELGWMEKIFNRR